MSTHRVRAPIPIPDKGDRHLERMPWVGQGPKVKLSARPRPWRWFVDQDNGFVRR